MRAHETNMLEIKTMAGFINYKVTNVDFKPSHASTEACEATVDEGDVAVSTASVQLLIG